jgi:hypothetical protein
MQVLVRHQKAHLECAEDFYQNGPVGDVSHQSDFLFFKFPIASGLLPGSRRFSNRFNHFDRFNHFKSPGFTGSIISR